MKAEAEDISVEAEVVDDKAHHKARHKKGFENYILYYSLEIIELMLSILFHKGFIDFGCPILRKFFTVTKRLVIYHSKKIKAALDLKPHKIVNKKKIVVAGSIKKNVVIPEEKIQQCNVGKTRRPRDGTITFNLPICKYLV